jgi:hypothetical protein
MTPLGSIGAANHYIDCAKRLSRKATAGLNNSPVIATLVVIDVGETREAFGSPPVFQLEPSV